MKANQRVTRWSLAIAVLLVGSGLGARTATADPEAVARRHAAKANQLAARNRCRAAVPEFNRALKVLKDPALLFNRAECLRKLGRGDEALTDYERFLVEMPNTPNRATVEARILALRGIPAPGTTSHVELGAKKEPAAASGKEPAVPGAKPAEKPAATVAKEPAAPAAKVAEKPAVPPARAPAATPAKPTGKPAVSPAKEPAAPAPKPAGTSLETPARAPVAPAAKPAEKTPAAPIGRAKKWTD
ncbi:MAG: tetratricopeptide repeat protein [Deltaproteobacteria bacterium]|jgi:hypothetical protein|nr:tetratricopeptide repeat protein [Deltaproteobacteria bacterium]